MFVMFVLVILQVYLAKLIKLRCVFFVLKTACKNIYGLRVGISIKSFSNFYSKLHETNIYTTQRNTKVEGKRIISRKNRDFSNCFKGNCKELLLRNNFLLIQGLSDY